MDTALTTDNVTRVFQEGPMAVHALRGVSLKIDRGSFTSICGPSGSGKTTLLNIIGGLDTPTSGSVTIAGRQLESLNRRELAELRLFHVGFIFQSYNLIPVLTAKENVAFVMQLQGIATEERNERAMSILQEVGLNGMENRRPGELSGGQQQRVAVARAIVSEPEIVLADEPTANLDSTTAEGLLTLMRNLNEEKGVTFIFSTHDALVMEYARRLISLHDGQIQSDERRD